MCDSRQETEIISTFNLLIFLQIGYAQLHNYEGKQPCKLSFMMIVYYSTMMLKK